MKIITKYFSLLRGVMVALELESHSNKSKRIGIFKRDKILIVKKFIMESNKILVFIITTTQQKNRKK
jgi:hypothetical protein